MFANYHTHTCRCHHAEGAEAEYIEHAIRGGIKLLGFSDHTPYHIHEPRPIRTASEAKALALVKKYSLHLIKSVPLRRI